MELTSQAETAEGELLTHENSCFFSVYKHCDLRRAEVKTATGMGLIDRRGAWVIPPVYEIVDYDPVESNVYVRKGGLWAEFDYLGRQQSDFGEREART